jgi:methyl-accepting chemotaxis protein
MKLQARFVLSISAGIVVVLLVSEIVRQSYEGSRLADFEKRNPELMEATTRENLTPVARSVQSALEDVMAEGNMDLLDKILVRQGKVNNVLGVTFYNAKGKAIHASDREDVGGRLDSAVYEQVMDTGKRFDRRVGDAFEIYEPFIAVERCIQCHSEWKLGQVGGVLGVRLSNTSLVKAQRSLLDSMQTLRHGTVELGASVSLGLVIVLVVLVHALVKRQLTQPLATATNFVEVISAGDLTHTIDEKLRARSDETGTLARAMDSMATKLRDLLQRILDGVQTMSTTSQALSSVAEQTAREVQRVASKSESAANGAESSSSQASSVAAAIEEASSNLTSVSSATSEITSKVGEIAEQSEASKRTTQEAAAQAHDILASMRGLGEAAQAIGQVTETITRISAQTNLLALNATIEAARAGALGKGFAVVASEIKELALQTAQATQDVKEKIASVQASTESAMSGLESIASVIEGVGAMVSDTATALTVHAERSHGVTEQLAQASIGVSEANRGVAYAADSSRAIAADVGEIHAAVGEIRKGGEEVQHNAHKLLELGQELTELTRAFKLHS